MIIDTNVEMDCNLAAALRGPDSTDDVSQALKWIITARIRHHAEYAIGSVRSCQLESNKLQDILDLMSRIEPIHVMTMRHYLVHARWGIRALIERFAEKDTLALEALEQFAMNMGFYLNAHTITTDITYREVCVADLKTAWTALLNAERREEELGL